MLHQDLAQLYPMSVLKVPMCCVCLGRGPRLRLGTIRLGVVYNVHCAFAMTM